jgi:hypothetical protein
MIWRRRSGREELTPVEARQGYLDRPVLIVLTVSVLLACAAFLILMWRF